MKYFFLKLNIINGQAIGFSGVTILLSLTVFLNLVAESMPTTSDAVPLIGKISFPSSTYFCRANVKLILGGIFTKNIIFVFTGLHFFR